MFGESAACYFCIIIGNELSLPTVGLLSIGIDLACFPVSPVQKA